MAEFQQYLERLDADPTDEGAFAALESELSRNGATVSTPETAVILERLRKSLRERGALELVAKLVDVEIGALEDTKKHKDRQADLLLEKGDLYVNDLLEDQPAVKCFKEVLELRPDDETATETLAHLDMERDNWQKFVQKNLDEAEVSTNRGLTTHMYLSAAKLCARYQPDSDDIETYLRKAIDADAKNRQAAIQLERLLLRQERWGDLAEFHDQRADAAGKGGERVRALLGVADLATTRLDDPDRALEAMKKVIAAEPGHPQALRVLADSYEQSENWSALVMLYTGALKARRRAGSRDGETGMLLQIAMLQWKRLDNMDAAEEHFRRIRKVDPAHPAALDFYRAYYPHRGEGAKLLQALRQAQKSLPGDDEAKARKRAISVEIAELAENELGNPEKAIDAWKSILRAEPGAEDARAGLKRLYRKTEKWNALLDMMKDEIERLPKDDVDGRVTGLMDVVAIYRDRLKLDVMVINTYNSILKLDPRNRQALDDLAGKYEALGRWNDLIAVLTRKADIADAPLAERADLLRRIAGLWSERFGNYAQAIKPLEQLIEIAPDDAEAVTQLEDIYTRRRQWRPLIALLERKSRKRSGDEKRAVEAEMARLATERLGDNRLAIELWNRVLPYGKAAGEPNCDPDALAALSKLYEREKRHPALAEIYRRQRLLAPDDKSAVAILEKLGTLLSDRLQAPAEAARVLRQILDIQPKHNRALRTLRDLYAAAGDHQALEELYGQLGQWDELIEALHAMADRRDDRDEKLALLERAAEIAAERLDNPDKVARAYERVQSVDAKHRAAAQALVPLYESTEKWARLLSSYEVLLEHAESDPERLDIHLKIRALCEDRLGSKALAFQWIARAFDLDPDNPQLLDELQRLGGEADQWDQVAELLAKRVDADDIGDEQKLRLLRELGKISAMRLHEPERARDYQRKVLILAPDDPEAMTALEDIATRLSEWPDLLEVYRRRVELAESDSDKTDLLFKIAFIEEERLADFDASARTYQSILDVDPDSQRAMRALAKLHEARGDWAGLAEVLTRELAYTDDIGARVDRLLRIGGLRADSLDRADDALDSYKEALSAAPEDERVHSALERFLDSEGYAGRSWADRVSIERRVEVAELLLPLYEEAVDPERIARAIEVLRQKADDDVALDYDRRLTQLYGLALGDDRQAFDSGLRVLAADPLDTEVRASLARYADALDANAELAKKLTEAVKASAEHGDPTARRALAAELARLYDERLEAPRDAERAWLDVLDLPEGDGEHEAEAYDALARIYRSSARFADLRDLLTRREENTLDGDARKDIVLAICELEETVLDSPARAIAAYHRVLEIDPTHMKSYKALERLLHEKESFSELEELIGRELDYTDDEGERTALLYRRAELRAHKLDNSRGAVDLLERVVDSDPGHEQARALLEEIMANPDLRLRIARILEPLYESESRWSLLCAVLRAQGEFAASPHDLALLLGRVAQVEEENMSEPERAFATWTQAFTADPGSEGPRQAVLRLAAALDRWSDTAQAYEEALQSSDSGDVALSGELLGELAEIYDRDLTDTEKAISAFVRLYELDPGNPETVRPAITALARLYQEQQRWPELIEALRRQAEWVDGPEERKALLAKVAFIEEEKQEDGDAAVTTWREVLTEDPEDGSALDALERLLAAQEKPAELCEILRRRVELADEPEERKRQLSRIAVIQENDLEDSAEAIVAYLEILDHLPEDRQTLVELSRLYGSRERFPDLLDILERRLGVAQGDDDAGEVADLTFAIAELLRAKLTREREALERYADVLQVKPDHTGALDAVEGLTRDDELRTRASEILAPIYQAGGDHAELANLYLRVADGHSDPRDQLRYLRDVAELREQHLDDKNGAFDITSRAVKAAVSEPELPFLINELARLAAQLGREGDLIDIYAEVAPDVFDGELQRRLYLDVADLARAVRQDIELAREYYRRVLDGQPEDRRALSALESIYRVTDRHQELYEILMRKSEMAGDDFDAQAAALAEAAELCSDKLDRPEDAIIAWEQVLDITPENREAVDSLEKLYEESSRYHDLVELLDGRLGYVQTLEEAVNLRYRLGHLYEDKLSDPDAAVENYSAALGGDPDHEGAIEALEQFLDDAGLRNAAADVLYASYVKQQDWIKLVRIYEIKLEVAEEPSERAALTRHIASLYEEQLEDLKGASLWYGRVFREEPTDAGVRDQLWRLATILDNWGDLARVYQAFIDEDAGDGPEVAEVARTLGHIYNDRLDEIERGQAVYRRVLELVPDDNATFDRLESMLTRGERWYALVEVYEDAIAATESSERQQALYVRMAQIYETYLHDADHAIDAYRSVLDINPDHPRAAEELERLYQGESKWYDLSELLSRQIDRSMARDLDSAGAAGIDGADDADDGVPIYHAEDTDRVVAFRMRLADVMETRLDDIAGAIDQYEMVLAADSGWQRALSPLERLVMVEEHQERIAAILEPVYRANDEWRKLVVVLNDVQVKHASDPARRVEILREVAQLHETRGGDPNQALEALSRAWLEDVHDIEVYDELSVQAAKLGAWDRLVETLEKGTEEEYDTELVASIRSRVAEIHEGQREDMDAAIGSWRQVLEAIPDEPEALGALDRLLAQEGRFAELVDIVQRRADLTDDENVRLVMLHRIAALREDDLDEPLEAIAAYKNVLTVNDADREALDALERLYRSQEQWMELAETLTRKIELAETPDQRRQLRFVAAEVQSGKLEDSYEAIALYNAVLDENFDDDEALARLDDLYGDESMWPELLDVLDRRQALEADSGKRAELAYRAALMVENELLEPETAIDRYASVLDMSANHPGARHALERLASNEDTIDQASAVLERIYREESDYEKLAELYERRLSVPTTAPDPHMRRGQYADLAELYEVAHGAPDAAFEVWARALEERPDDDEALSQLERLAAARGAWEDLIALLEERLVDIVDAELEYHYATKLAGLYEEALGDLDKAAEKYRQALQTAADESAPLSALDRIYSRAGKPEDLAEILAMEAEASNDETEQCDFLFRLGDLRETSLRDTTGAVTAYSDVLERMPRHTAARSALERLLLSAESERPQVISILEPLYENEGELGRLADLLTAKLSITADHIDRAQIYSRVAQLAEHDLSDPVRALDATGGWLAEDPHSIEALEQLERLAEVVNRWGEVAARLQGIIQSAGSQAGPSGGAEDVERALLGKLGAIQLHQLGDAAAAEETFRALLAIEPETTSALESLATIYRARGDGVSLSDTLWRLGELTYDGEAKRAYLVEVGSLREELTDLPGAITAWREVLSLDDSDRLALDHLAAIYGQLESWIELIEILGQTARYARNPDEERELRTRVAMIYTDTLGQLDDAVEAWQAVLDISPDPHHAIAALRALEQVHRQREDWSAVNEALIRHLDTLSVAGVGNDELIALHHQLSDLAVNKLDAIDDAVAQLYQVLDIDNGHLETYLALERLLAKAERWHDLVELLERRAEMHGAIGDGQEVAALARAADIWEENLQDPDAAGDILEKILARDPDYVPALTRLGKIYENAGDWERCGEVLQRALALGPVGRDAAELQFRMGEVIRRRDDDVDTAMGYWSQALGADPTYTPAIQAIENLARERENWAAVVEMVTRREALTSDESDKLELALELADLYQNKVGEPAHAIPLLERAAQIAGDDPRVQTPLADLYFAAGRHAEAAPIYSALADAAKKARKMKNVAMYRQRLGGIFEAQGQIDDALAAYEEAFRVNPTDVATMAGLGRLYLQRETWDKARRVYRSLVLQNIDPSMGLTKAEVYFHLGNIHVKLGEENKAKGMFRRGLELEPDNASIKQALDAIS